MICGLVASAVAYASDAPLDKNARPGKREEIPNAFKDMGVVQKRAMAKEKRFLFSVFGGFDFSDGPYTNYSMNVNPGYAFSDFFEVYLNFAPAFIVSRRSIVDVVEQLTLQDGKRAEIVAARPQRQIGAELLWAPAYGKDSLGLRTIIRSDTFLKLGVSQVSYDAGTGMRFVLGLGKTYFIGSHAGFRICVDFGHIQTIVNDTKSYRDMALVETGLVLYL